MNSSAQSVKGSISPGKLRSLRNTIELHLELGRVSNLPTVWSNVFCGAVVALSASGASHTLSVPIVMGLMFAMSFFYIAGMYLNDACDAAIDGVERPGRPIPSGRIKQFQVLAFSVAWFFCGWLLLIVISRGFIAEGKSALHGFMAAAALTGCIVLYDLFHKNNPASPIIMGLCRVLVVLTSYLVTLSIFDKPTDLATTVSPHFSVLGVCVLVLVYLSGLTFIAKFENQTSLMALWPILALLFPVGYGLYASFNSTITLVPTLILLLVVAMAVMTVRGRISGGIPKSIGLLIAAISLIDAIIMSTLGSMPGMIFGIAAFLLTLLLQRKIAGT